MRDKQTNEKEDSEAGLIRAKRPTVSLFGNYLHLWVQQ